MRCDGILTLYQRPAGLLMLVNVVVVLITSLLVIIVKGNVSWGLVATEHKGDLAYMAMIHRDMTGRN